MNSKRKVRTCIHTIKIYYRLQIPHFYYNFTMRKLRPTNFRKQYPCSICTKDCKGAESVVCFGCGKWLHDTCVEPALTKELHRQWSAAGLKFYCRACCYEENRFDFEHSLLRYRFYFVYMCVAYLSHFFSYFVAIKIKSIKRLLKSKSRISDNFTFK